jgi:hypothetical protein
MSMRKLFAYLGLGMLVAGLNSLSLSAKASVLQQPHLNFIREITIAQADQSDLVKENRQLLLTNGALARKIAGITSSEKVPTSGTPLEQNQVLILQNQETFKAIAAKVGATVPTLAPIAGASSAEKNHKLLLQNKSIVVAVMKKLGIPLAPPPELTGTFVDKNHTLLIGNGKALAKIAAKLGM